MNPRIFKKLTKKASVIGEKIGAFRKLERVVVSDDDGVETAVNVDMKHRDRFYKNKIYGRSHFQQLHGTVGYGCVSGYEYQEWSDYDAYSELRKYIIDSFTDWENFQGEGWPENNCPRAIKRNVGAMFRYARSLIVEAV